MSGLTMALITRLLCWLMLCAITTSQSTVKKERIINGRSVLSSSLIEFYRNVQQPATRNRIRPAAAYFSSIGANMIIYGNQKAAQIYADMLKNKYNLPREIPFSANEPSHALEAETLFKVLYSAKGFDNFYNTAAYLRDIVNEGLFVYTLSIAIIYRPDTIDVFPPLYEVFPNLFTYPQVIATAKRINVHGLQFVKSYPSTYIKGKSVVIKENASYWPYINDRNFALSYFTNDIGLNHALYLRSLVYPKWLSGSSEPSVINKDGRGEHMWFEQRQLMNQYYFNRLSEGMGEIPDITDVFKDGLSSSLVHCNGAPFPSRPNDYRIDQTKLATVMEYERRIMEAIDKGFYVNSKGENVYFLNDTGLETLGRLIESNADSPNRHYYKDIINIWKQILGHSNTPEYRYESNFTSLVVPSALENYATARRDPAYYSIMKRVLKLFSRWQKRMPPYKPEELIVPVVINQLEVDELVTFFEPSFVNISRGLYEKQEQGRNDVLISQPRLNHRSFKINVQINSRTARKVVVKSFLAPKCNNRDLEISLNLYAENFLVLDEFSFNLPPGESVIIRNSSEFVYSFKNTPTKLEILERKLPTTNKPTSTSKSFYPDNLLLPKGKVGGQTFQFVVYIQNANVTRNSAFPFDRPLNWQQIKDVKNLMFKDVKIYHKA